MKKILFVFTLYIIWGCTMPPNPSGTSIENSNKSTFKSLDIKLVPQKGDNSCWAASLIMAYKHDTSKNNENAPARPFKKIKEEIKTTVIEDSILTFNDLSWEKIKQNFDLGHPLLFYKYFNDKEAHVFVGQGYQETNTEKWILVNDPWPKNIGNINATAFDNLIKPIFSNVPEIFPKINLGKDFENSFSILGKYKVTEVIVSKDTLNKTTRKLTYSLAQSNPNLKKIPAEVTILAQDWIKNINRYDKNFLSMFNIENSYNQTNLLKIDLKSLTEVTNVFDYKYDENLNLSLKNKRTDTVRINENKGSLYDPYKVYYVTIIEDTMKKVVLSIETDVRNKRMFISKIEPYYNSKQSALDKVGNALKVDIPFAKILDTKQGYLVYFKLNETGKELVYDRFDHISNVNKMTPVFNDVLGKIKVFNASEAILKPQFKNNNKEN